jgi:abortive infection bacteriophage resistance protein
MKFSKPALSVAAQIGLLKKRGLQITDENEAAHYLSFIGYYRLSGYSRPLSITSPTGDHSFKPNTSFDDILNLYRFDRELRLLVMDAIERR